MIRAHEEEGDGYKFYMWDKENNDPACITIFSAPNYCHHENRASVFLISPKQKSKVLTYGESPYQMYYLRNRGDALTTFMPAIVEETIYLIECLYEWLKNPDEIVRRMSGANFGGKANFEINGLDVVAKYRASNVQHLELDDFNRSYKILNDDANGFGYALSEKEVKVQWLWNTDNTIRSVKIIDKLSIDDRETRDLLFYEIEKLKQFREDTEANKGIVCPLEVFEGPMRIFLVMELIEDQELFEYISARTTFSEIFVSKMIKQILTIIAFCHRNDIAHRDLKPENLILVENEIKIKGFGASHHAADHENIVTLKFGSPYHLAPEVL